MSALCWDRLDRTVPLLVSSPQSSFTGPPCSFISRILLSAYCLDFKRDITSDQPSIYIMLANIPVENSDHMTKPRVSVEMNSIKLWILGDAVHWGPNRLLTYTV